MLALLVLVSNEQSVPTLLTGISVTEEMVNAANEKQNLLTTLPLFSTKDLDFASLKLILAQALTFSGSWRKDLNERDPMND